MVRFKTKADNKGKEGNEVYHIVATRSLDVIQDHWTKTNTILGVMIRKTYKTLNGATKGVKEGETIILEKPMGI
jgi:hypothetical protein